MSTYADLPELPAEGWATRFLGEQSAIGLPLNSTSQALENSRRVKAGAGTLLSITGFNNKAAAQFIQVFDASDVPADGAIPVIVLTVATVANFSLIYSVAGRAFRTGIVVCNSSTLVTKTIALADCWFDVQYV